MNISIPKSNRILTLIDQAANSGGNLLLTIIIARLLNPSDFGFYSIGLLLGMLSMEACQTLVAAPAQTIGPKLSADQLKGYCRSTAQLSLFLASMTAIAIFCGTIIYGFIYGLEAPLVKGFLYLLAAAGMQLHLWARRIAYVCNKITAAAIGSSFRYFIHLIAAIFIGYANFKNSPELHLIALGVSGLIAAFLTTFLWWPAKVRENFPFLLALKKHLNFGKWLFGAGAINWFGSNWFIAITGTMMGTASIGVLKAAQNIAGITGIIVQIMENVVPIKAARLMANKGTKASFQYVMRIGSLTIGTGSIITFFLVIFSSDIMALVYTEAYRKFGFVLALVSITYIMSLVVFLLKVIFRTVEIVRPIFITQILIAIMTLSSAGKLVSHYGILGAAIGLMLVQFVSALVLSIFACHLIKQLEY